ncbi:DUF1211 domain-containing protein [Mesorhizobium sp. AR02]|uniref:TMEM175 family protein n=1 Tax=Mesorhizobium sp. AR02 TaxID=2865837 RepID=UPI00215F4CA8|nr:TMEM175 family protein [Mesorhizobium sp. AR02]UVK51880.1 DUF1211 domain-containing protein [Mesorhizobium sp. AR02]
MPATSQLPRNRLDALVDGILAITMTLLVFGLPLPDDIHGNLFGALGELRPKIVSWVVSFLILALCWQRHVIDFRQVGHVDGRLFRLVVLWLLVTSVVPFTTTLIGEHDELLQSHIVYAVNIIAIQLVAVLRDLHLKAHPELFVDGKAEGHEIGWRPALIIGLSALASVALAFWRPTEASLAYLLIWPLTLLANRLRSR